MTVLIKSAAAGAVITFALLTGGEACAADLPKDANTTCPVMTKEEVDPDLFVDYKGERIYVCCTKCKKQFAKDPEKYLARMNRPNDGKTSSSAESAPAPKQ